MCNDTRNGSLVWPRMFLFQTSRQPATLFGSFSDRSFGATHLHPVHWPLQDSVHHSSVHGRSSGSPNTPHTGYSRGGTHALRMSGPGGQYSVETASRSVSEGECNTMLHRSVHWRRSGSSHTPHLGMAEGVLIAFRMSGLRGRYHTTQPHTGHNFSDLPLTQ